MLGFKRFETAAVTILGPWSRPLNICEAFSPEKNMYLIIFGAREPFCVHRIRIAPEHSFRSCREPNIKVFADRAPECLQIPDRPLKQALAIVEIQSALGMRLVTIGELDAHREESPKLIASEAIEDTGS
jgi:hypothetical protein